MTDYIKQRAICKALQSQCNQKVSAIGLNKRGEFIGSAVNTSRFVRYGGGMHAEAILIKRFGRSLKYIIICRVNNSGGLLPIDPCNNCLKLANKFGIKIISITKN